MDVVRLDKYKTNRENKSWYKEQMTQNKVVPIMNNSNNKNQKIIKK